MFEKFTEKAINIVKTAQMYAIEHNHAKIYPEHLLLAILNDSNNIIVKAFYVNKIKIDVLKDEIVKILNKKAVIKPVENISFSDMSKDVFIHTLGIAKLLGSSYVQPEHIFISVLECDGTEIITVLKEKGIDASKIKNMLYNVLSKHKPIKLKHPEVFAKRRRNDDKTENLSTLLESADNSGIFSRAIAKLSTSQYEILGTEQIMLSILEDSNSETAQILSDFGITTESFNEKLNEISSRQAEFGDKQIIFTPNAMKMLLIALDAVREDGSATILPEHIVWGLLKSKQGIAYNILKEFNINDYILEEQLRKPIEKQGNETLNIMRIAKQEAKRLGSNVVGSELILLGIVLEGKSVAAEVLRNLGVIVKDTREVVENLIGINDDYNNNYEITLSQRAKLILEDAWNIAKSRNKTKTSADDLLIAICNQPDSVAMKALSKLGVDALEIRQGIKNELENIKI